MKVLSRVTRKWLLELSELLSDLEQSCIELRRQVIDFQKLCVSLEDKGPMKEPSMEQV